MIGRRGFRRLCGTAKKSTYGPSARPGIQSGAVLPVTVLVEERSNFGLQDSDATGLLSLRNNAFGFRLGAAL